MNYGPGQLPACNAPCPLPNGTSFPNVRNGSYPIWNIVRIITDSSGPNKTAVQDLLTAGQAEVNGKVPDFVPFVCNTAGPKCNGEPGLVVFRSHYKIAKVTATAHNGNTNAAEAGGDIGGGVFPLAADVDFHADTNKELTNYRQ